MAKNSLKIHIQIKKIQFYSGKVLQKILKTPDLCFRKSLAKHSLKIHIEIKNLKIGGPLKKKLKRHVGKDIL